MIKESSQFSLLKYRCNLFENHLRTRLVQLHVSFNQNPQQYLLCPAQRHAFVQIALAVDHIDHLERVHIELALSVVHHI